MAMLGGRKEGDKEAFLRAALQPLGMLFVFGGRTSRRQFWSYVLVLWVVAVIVAFALRAAAPDLLIAALLPVLLVEYLLLWAVAVRRLHDTGRSGWMLLVSLIPLIGLLVLLVWFTIVGDPGGNRFGTKPLS
jgi:uncharacterized membrane protein YhaH (DUF805 family)